MGHWTVLYVFFFVYRKNYELQTSGDKKIWRKKNCRLDEILNIERSAKVTLF